MQDLLQEVKQLKKKVEELEGEKGQYERKLRGTKVCDERAHKQATPDHHSFVYVGAIKIKHSRLGAGAEETAGGRAGGQASELVMRTRRYEALEEQSINKQPQLQAEQSLISRSLRGSTT